MRHRQRLHLLFSECPDLSSLILWPSQSLEIWGSDEPLPLSGQIASVEGGRIKRDGSRWAQGLRGSGKQGGRFH
jgi:hypothetical protein